MVKRVASQCMENVDIVDDLTVASVWMTLPTPFPQPDPLPPDPITPVEPSPLCYGWSTTVVPTAPTAPRRSGPGESHQKPSAGPQSGGAVIDESIEAKRPLRHPAGLRERSGQHSG